MLRYDSLQAPHDHESLIFYDLDCRQSAILIQNLSKNKYLEIHMVNPVTSHDSGVFDLTEFFLEFKIFWY